MLICPKKVLLIALSAALIPLAILRRGATTRQGWVK